MTCGTGIHLLCEILLLTSEVKVIVQGQNRRTENHPLVMARP